MDLLLSFAIDENTIFLSKNGDDQDTDDSTTAANEDEV